MHDGFFYTLHTLDSELVCNGARSYVWCLVCVHLSATIFFWVEHEVLAVAYR